MTALASIRAAGFEADHAATYKDPISGKLRAFDIRARWSGNSRSLRFAVECKNLRANAPLLIHATPRTPLESTHSVVARYQNGPGIFYPDAIPREGCYRTNEPVGRQTDQPSKDASGDFKSTDSETYEKWIQAVSGCQDLVREMVSSESIDSQLCAVVPVLVIPDGMLWQVEYAGNGDVVAAVRQVARSSLILRQTLSVDARVGLLHYNLSHIEVVTLSELAPRMSWLSGPDGLCAGAVELLEQKSSG